MSLFTQKNIQPDSGFWGQLAQFVLKTQQQTKRPLVIALLSGILLGLAHAPIYFFAGLYIAIPVLIWLMASATSKKSAFWVGWAFGMGYFTIGLYWIASSMLVDLSYAWMIPFSVLGLPALYSVGIGIISVLVNRLQPYISPVILLPCLWVIFEIIRSSGTLAFPWLQLGYISLISDGLSQGASLVGVFGLSLFFMLSASIIAPAPFSEVNRRKALFSSAFILPLVLLIWGNSRVASHPTTYTNTVVKIIQPNIQQENKWQYHLMQKNLISLIEQSAKPIPSESPLYGHDIDAIIWPETAFTYTGNQYPTIVNSVTKAMPNQAPLITGAPRIKGKDYDTIFNSVQVFKNGEITQTYDKIHLVPFGEFIPYKQYLPKFISTITRSAITAGINPNILTVGDMTFRPLVCYEIAFNETVATTPTGKRPNVFLNVTNDGWFGNTSGPYQHLDIARMRAIEYGIPVIRAANTGISATIDAVGRIIHQLPLNKQGEIITFIPDSITTTLFATHQNRILYLLLVVLIIIGTTLSFKMRRKKGL